MALTYQGTEPTVIKYNGSDVEVVKIKRGANGTATSVWGKPFSCYCVVAGKNRQETSAFLARVNSPNEHAEIGIEYFYEYGSGSAPKTVYKGDTVSLYFSTEYLLPSGDFETNITNVTVTHNNQSVAVEQLDNKNWATDNFTVNGEIACVVQVAVNKYTLTLTKNANIDTIYYAIGSGSYIAVTSSQTVQVDFGATVHLFAVAASGYTTEYNESNILAITMGNTGYTFSPVATAAVQSWRTIWTGSKSLGVSGTLDEFADTTITVNELPASITSNTPFKMYATTSGAYSGDTAKWITEDNEPQQFDYDKRSGNKSGIATLTVWDADYASSTSVQIMTRLDDQSGTMFVIPSVKVTQIDAYY